MCDAKPGIRCAADTRGHAVATLDTYRQANPDGPAVDPLAAGADTWIDASSSAHITQQQRELDDAVRRLEDHESAHGHTIAAPHDARAKAESAYTAAHASADQSRAAAEEALARAHELYVSAGVRGRMADYYVADMRLDAGLGDEVQIGRYDRVPVTNKLQALVESGAPRVKVKRTGPDRAAMVAAASASATDEQFNAALARYTESRESARGHFERYDALDRKAERLRVAAYAVSSEAERLAAQVDAATKAIATAKTRAKAGLNLDGGPTHMGNLDASDIRVNADGTTNVWVMNEADGDEPTYERVVGFAPYRTVGGEGQSMVTASGRPVVKYTHHANYTSTTSDPAVWIDPPQPGARQARDVAPHLVLHDVSDSGG